MGPVYLTDFMYFRLEYAILFLYFRPFSAAWLYFFVQSHYMLMNSDLHTSSQAKRLFAFELAMQCALSVSFPSCQQKVH